MQIDQEKLNDAIHNELERLFNKGHLREGEFLDINVEVIHLMTATPVDVELFLNRITDDGYFDGWGYLEFGYEIINTESYESIRLD